MLFRSAGAFLSAAAGFLLFIVFSYLREGFDPTAWIQWSAPRLLMTPLVFLFFAGLSGSGPLSPEASNQTLEKRASGSQPPERDEVVSR